MGRKRSKDKDLLLSPKEFIKSLKNITRELENVWQLILADTTLFKYKEDFFWALAYFACSDLKAKAEERKTAQWIEWKAFNNEKECGNGHV